MPVDADDPDERARVVSEDDAWVIFTSGSTGKPKGVAVTHRNAAAFVDAEQRMFLVEEPIGPGDRVMAGLSVAFDASCEELTDGVIVAAQPHGAPTWFPCNDRPSNKATYANTIAAPSDYYVAMSGRLTDTRRRGSVTEWTWEMPQPMATYLATVQIGRYEARDLENGVVVIAPPDLRGEGYDASFGQQPAMMAFFESVFGVYPFDAYTVVVTDDPLEIPLESQSLSTFGRNFASDDWDAVRLVAHELAHQWFGNAVTLREWKDIWLHEGFACYAEWLWSEESGRESAASQAAHHHAKLADLDQDLLLALRAVVGDHDFFDILQTWVERFAFSNATTADFEALAAEISGESLAELFDAWR